MSDFLITPLMGLPNPVPGVDPGPDYADNIQSCFNILDGHNHSSGSGNQVNTSGILINADLPFNSNYNATLLRSVRFAPHSLPLGVATDLGCMYEAGGELYYNDASGNQVQITLSGTVNATSSGISGGTATASFSGGVLIVNKNTNTPGNVQCGSVLVGDNTVSSNFVTLTAPTALASSYPLVFPAALPGAQSFVSLDTSGNIAAYASVSGGITGSNIASGTIVASNMAANSIATASIQNGSVTEAKLAAANTSNNSFGSTARSTVGETLLAQATVTFTGTRPALISIQADTVLVVGSSANASGYVKIFDVTGSVTLLTASYGNIAGTALAVSNSTRFPGVLQFIDYPVAGSRQYEAFLGLNSGAGSNSITISAGKITVTEL